MFSNSPLYTQNLSLQVYPKALKHFYINSAQSCELSVLKQADPDSAGRGTGPAYCTWSNGSSYLVDKGLGDVEYQIRVTAGVKEKEQQTPPSDLN